MWRPESTSNIQHSTFNIQRPTSNVQRPNSEARISGQKINPIQGEKRDDGAANEFLLARGQSQNAQARPVHDVNGERIDVEERQRAIQKEGERVPLNYGEEMGAKKCDAATNNQRKSHRQDGATRVGLVCSGQANAAENDLPNSADKPATNRNDKKWISRAAGEADYAEGCLKRLLCSPNNHEAKMQNCGTDKRADGHDQGHKNNKEQWPDPATHHVHYRVFVTAKQLGRAQQTVVKKINHPAHAAADDGINERLAHAAFALHHRERFRRSGQNHYQGIEKGAQNSALLPIIPRKAGARRDCRRGSNSVATGELRLGAGRAARPGFLREFGNLRKRLPGCHPFAPAEIGADEFSDAQSFAHFIFRKCSMTGAAAVDMKSSHTVGFYVVAAIVSRAEVSVASPRVKMLKELQSFTVLTLSHF